MTVVRCWACVGTGEIFNDSRKTWEKCYECNGLGEIDYNPEDYTYAADEWHDDSWEEYGVHYVDTEFDTLPLPPVVDKRNPILRIVSAVVLFALRLFRLDPKDRIPF